MDSMNTMVPCLLLLCLISSAGVSAGERTLKQDKLQLKVGIRQGLDIPFRDCDEDGNCDGFDPVLTTQICDILDADCEIVLLGSLEDRITSLENGTTDFVMDVFSVTDARKERINFVNPFYYAAGAALFVNDIADLPESWTAIEGEKVCIVEGYFVIEEIRNEYKPDFMEFELQVDRDEAFQNGDCIAVVADNVDTSHGGEQVGPIMFEFPFGLGISKENDELEVMLAGALVELMDKGKNSSLLQQEEEIIIPAGIKRLPVLEEVIIAITDFK